MDVADGHAPRGGAVVAPADDGILYHYTNAAALLGIITNREIWATETDFLNDPTEARFAADRVGERLEKLRQDSIEGGRSVVEIDHVIRWFRRTYLGSSSRSVAPPYRAFVTSFSRSDDVLTLWRNYAGPNGFCVGFSQRHLTLWCKGPLPSANDQGADSEETAAILANDHLSASVSSVAYGDAAATQLSDEVASIVNERGFTFRESKGKVLQVLQGLVSIKHDAYADEREARLIVHRNLDACFGPDPSLRVSPSMGLVAYHKLVFPHQAVVSIVAAPGKDQSRTENAVRYLLSDGARGGWSHVYVHSSDIPFNW